MALSADILRGYTDTIILRQLSRGDSYGYQINKNVAAISGGTFKLTGSLNGTKFRVYNADAVIDAPGKTSTFHADGWFLLHCLTALLKNGKLKEPTEGQRKSLMTLIVPQ